ncbi:MAG: HAD-IA family hydrolase [FCB group bacterium]|nr:HAD-IA family hydrolase [FCB group bacterium]
MTPRITTIFFDLFGVLLGTDQSAVIHYISKQLKKPYRECREIVTGEIYMRYERREIDFKTYLAELLRALPEGDLLDPEELRLRWLNRQIAELPLAGLLRPLALRYQVWVLSNTTSDHVNLLKSQFDFLRLPHGFVTSQAAGVPKPHPGIFQFALQRARAAASHSVFIDDTRRHVNAARELGFIAHLHQDFESTEDFLKKITGLPL